MFATHGIPEVITSDNVPFGSEEFTPWCKQLGIRHPKININNNNNNIYNAQIPLNVQMRMTRLKAE